MIRPEGSGRAALLAVGLLTLAALLGAAVAWSLRRCMPARHRERRAVLAAISTSAIVAPCAWVLRHPIVSVFDPVVLAVVLGGAALALGAPTHPPRIEWRSVVASTVLAVAALLPLELWARAHPPARVFSAPPMSVEPFIARDERDFRCAAFLPDSEPRFARYGGRGLLAPSGHRRVMHVGDSMVESFDVPREATFTVRLEQLRRPDEHVNLGVSAMGTDAELLVARKWLPRLHPTEVVLHVFPGNDLDDLDAPYACCDDGPLLGPSPAVMPRCPLGSWHTTFANAWHLAPPPFLLRAFVPWSALARRYASGFVVGVPLREGGFVLAERLDRLTAIVRAFSRTTEDAGVALSVVVLPTRAGYVHRFDVPHDVVVEALRATGVRTLDAGPAFDEAVRTSPGGRWFQPDAANPHFDVEGERLYADWLASQLWPGP